MEGGLRWREGIENCVFKPSVGCAKENADGFLERNNQGSLVANPNIPARKPGMISRIVKNDSADFKNEKILRGMSYFKPLIDLGYISVNTNFCTPMFTKEDKDFAQNFRFKMNKKGPCYSMAFSAFERPEDYKNLITPEYGMNLDAYLIKNNTDADTLLILLRGAVSAAIALVPDNGVWVVHGDLHYENILVSKASAEKHTALSDWGRCMVFNTKNIKLAQLKVPSIYEGLKNYLQVINKGWTSYSSFIDLLEKKRDYDHIDYNQHSYNGLQKISDLYDELEKYSNTNKVYDEDIFNEGMNALRGYMVYSILNIYFIYNGLKKIESTDLLLNKLLETNSQQELIDYVNKILPSIDGQPYYTLGITVVPSKTTRATTATGGRRKIKKQATKHKRKHANKTKKRRI